LLIDWGSIIEWMPAGYIQQLRMEGTGVGSVRHLLTGQGVVVSERLDETDRENGLLKLSIIEPMPWEMLSYNAYAQLRVVDTGQSRLCWHGTFEMTENSAAADSLAALLKKSYEKMFEGIKIKIQSQSIENDNAK
jgi:hypothetical protein